MSLNIHWNKIFETVFNLLKCVRKITVALTESIILWRLLRDSDHDKILENEPVNHPKM